MTEPPTWPVTSREGTKSRVDFCYFVFASFKRVRSARHSKVQQQQRALFACPYKYIQCCESYFKNQNYIIGKLRYFGTVICHEDQSKLKYIFVNHQKKKNSDKILILIIIVIIIIIINICIAHI